MSKEQGVLTEQAPKRVNQFKLGADPEFCLVDKITGWALQSVNGLYDVRADTQIGRDCGYLVELRPKPAKTAYELVARIKTLIESPVLEPVHPFHWRSGAFMSFAEQGRTAASGNLTMGGHIHFEMKFFPVERKMAKQRIAVSIDNLGNRVYEDREVCLSEEYKAGGALNSLTALLEHLDILPAAESSSRCHSSSYGTLGDSIRPSSHSYEYRKMCSWLFHPRVAFVALTCAKLCVVAPEEAASALMKKTSFEDLKAFVELFKEKDDDAARLSERIFPRGLERTKADHTVDFRPIWRHWQPTGVVLE